MTDTTLPWYSDAEINDMCKPLTQSAAQIRYLRGEGFTVGRKPGGRPLLMRSHAERILSGMPGVALEAGSVGSMAAQPNRAGLVLQFGSRRG